MRKGLFAAAGALLLGGTAAFGQAAPAPPPEWSGGHDFIPAVAADDDGAGWGRVTLSADYLVWWVQKGPTPGPLLTLGSIADDPFEGAVGQPHTTSLFGAHGIDYHTLSGLRVGAALDLGSDFGLDGNYFVLERRSAGVSAASDPTGAPIIARPVINAANGLSESYSTSFPGDLAGRSDAISHIRLQGFEINLAASLVRTRDTSLDVLVGYRFLNLQEDLLFNDALTPLHADYLTFNGAFVNPPGTLTDYDAFRTRNYFNGGQIGARWRQAFGALELGLTGKVALGATDQRVRIDGSTTLLTPGAAPVVAAGGILAQQSNSGSFSHNTFSVVPEVGVNVGWRVSDNLTATVGYTFLYWTDVARPAQIDPRVNPFVVPSDFAFGTGPAGGHPVFAAHNSDFWAQGLNFGVTLRF